MWPIFENVPHAFEKNVYFASLGWKTLYVSVKSFWSRTLFNAAISLLIFCLEDLSAFDSGELKSPTIIVLLSIFVEVLQGFPYVFGFSYVGCIGVCNVYVFLVDSSLEYYEVSLFMALVLKSILSDMNIATLAFLSCPFAWNIFSQPFSFSLCRCFILRWVSCREHMCGSHFLSHSATLCLLIRAFNPLTLKIIIDRCLFTPPLCTCAPLSFTLSFLFL